MALDRVPQLADAPVLERRDAHDRRLPRAGSAPATGRCADRRPGTSAPGRSALVTARTSGISIRPALIACTPSPLPGISARTTVSVSAWTSTSFCPEPTVSTSTTSKPAASRHEHGVGGGLGEAALVAAAGHRADEHAGVEEVVGQADPVAQHGAAGEGAGGVDAHHGHALVAAARRCRRARRSACSCPPPAAPVMPTRQARPVSGWRAATSSPPLRPQALDQADRPPIGAALAGAHPGDELLVRHAASASASARRPASARSPRAARR